METFSSGDKRTLSPELTKHQLFQELELSSVTYEILSNSTFSFITRTRQFLGNLDSLFFDSLFETLQSIRILLISGAFSDAYTLLRRFSDVSWLHVNLMLKLNDSSPLDELFGRGVAEMTSERFQELTEQLWHNGFCVEEIETWLKGDSSAPKKRKLDHFDLTTSVKEVYELLDRHKLSAIADRCNDHVHLNRFEILRMSGAYLSQEARYAMLGQFREDFKALLIRHICLTFAINPHYMASSDYFDALECGCEPLEGSQYWVAAFVQELFDQMIKPDRPDMAECIKNNSCMELN